ncbi:hypothetical protein [Streptomyces sp. NPDC048606]|uniref:hypothetical protein n=1 Tax=Streptomyces sp. NPDC048606 TaxID=3154726 RepID=UPI0034406446
MPSLAASRTVPAHDGPSATLPVNARCTRTDNPAVTRTGSFVPATPSGADRTTTAAPTPAAAAAIADRRPHPYRLLASMPRP